MSAGWGTRPLEVRATVTREGGIIHPQGASAPGREGLIPAPFYSHSDPHSPPSSPVLDLPRPLRGALEPQLSPSGKQLALRPHRAGARDCPKDSAVGTPSPEPFQPRLSGSPPLRGLSRFPPGPGAPRSPPSRRRRRSAVGRPARVAGSRGPPPALSARSEAIARRAGEEGRGRLYPRPQPQEARRFLAGAGTTTATWGAGATPGARGLLRE